ncbi:MAG: hypothetical protein RR385_03690 [Clostridiales bacterium]
MIFGMGMLEMGITFSFGQLILDDAIIGDMKNIIKKRQLPPQLNNKGYLHELVQEYRGFSCRIEPPMEQYRRFWQGAKKEANINIKANSIAEEIIATHQAEPLDRAVRNEIRRIVLSAE